MDVWRIASAIKARWKLFLLCMLLSVGAAVMIPRGSVEAVYVSGAKVLLTPPSSFDPSSRDLTRWWFTDESTLRELAGSERLLRRVIARLKLRRDWQDLKKSVNLNSAGHSGLRLSSGLFELTVEAPNPEMSQKIADALVDEFVLYIQELSAQEFANTRVFLENLVSEARVKVEQTENKLLAVTASRELAPDERDVLQTQGELDSERLKLRDELAVSEAELSAVTDFVDGRSTIPPWSVLREEGATSQELEQAVAKQRLALVELAETYRPDSQVYTREQARYNTVYGLYQGDLKKAASALMRERAVHAGELRARLANIETRLAELRTKKLSLEEKREVAKLERQLNVWEENRLDLIRQLYQARVSEQSSRRQGAISILERPAPGITPKEKRLPSVLRSLAVGVPFGLLFSFCMVVLVEYLSASLRLLPRIEESLGLPVLAVIPIMPEEMTESWEAIKTKAKMTGDDEVDKAVEKVGKR